MQRALINFDKKKLLKVARFLRQFSPLLLVLTVGLAFLTANVLSYFIKEKFDTGVAKRKPVMSSFGGESLTLVRRPNPSIQAAILDRNIFNSEGKVGDSVGGPANKKATDKVLRSELPIKLVGVIFSGDPFNGLAMIEVAQDRKVTSYMIGDKVTEEAVLYQVFDDRIILERGGGREYLELSQFEIVSSRKKGTGPARKERGGVKVEAVSARGATEFKEDGFERKSNNIKLTEEYKRNLLAPDNLTKILQDAKAEPNMEGGQLKGFKLTRIRENSVYEKAGFQDGDIIEEINGIPLRDAGGAIRLLNNLKSEKDIEVRLKRGDQVSNLSIQVQ